MGHLYYIQDSSLTVHSYYLLILIALAFLHLLQLVHVYTWLAKVHLSH